MMRHIYGFNQPKEGKLLVVPSYDTVFQRHKPALDLEDTELETLVRSEVMGSEYSLFKVLALSSRPFLYHPELYAEINGRQVYRRAPIVKSGTAIRNSDVQRRRVSGSRLVSSNNYRTIFKENGSGLRSRSQGKLSERYYLSPGQPLVNGTTGRLFEEYLRPDIGGFRTPDTVLGFFASPDDRNTNTLSWPIFWPDRPSVPYFNHSGTAINGPSSLGNQSCFYLDNDTDSISRIGDKDLLPEEAEFWKEYLSRGVGFFSEHCRYELAERLQNVNVSALRNINKIGRDCYAAPDKIDLLNRIINRRLELSTVPSVQLKGPSTFPLAVLELDSANELPFLYSINNQSSDSSFDSGKVIVGLFDPGLEVDLRETRYQNIFVGEKPIDWATYSVGESKAVNNQVVVLARNSFEQLFNFRISTFDLNTGLFPPMPEKLASLKKSVVETGDIVVRKSDGTEIYRIPQKNVKTKLEGNEVDLFIDEKREEVAIENIGNSDFEGFVVAEVNIKIHETQLRLFSRIHEHALRNRIENLGAINDAAPAIQILDLLNDTFSRRHFCEIEPISTRQLRIVFNDKEILDLNRLLDSSDALLQVGINGNRVKRKSLVSMLPNQIEVAVEDELLSNDGRIKVEVKLHDKVVEQDLILPKNDYLQRLRLLEGNAPFPKIADTVLNQLVTGRSPLPDNRPALRFCGERLGTMLQQIDGAMPSHSNPTGWLRLSILFWLLGIGLAARNRLVQQRISQ